MSITVNALVKDALLELGVVRENQTISDEQLQTGIKKLNQMMLDWEQDGIELGYYPVDDGADVVPIDRENEWGVTVNLAIVMAGPYGAPIQLSTAAEAKRTYQRLEKSTTTIVEASFDHLPAGISNRYNINTDE